MSIFPACNDETKISFSQSIPQGDKPQLFQSKFIAYNIFKK